MHLREAYEELETCFKKRYLETVRVAECIYTSPVILHCTMCHKRVDKRKSILANRNNHQRCILLEVRNDECCLNARTVNLIAP